MPQAKTFSRRAPITQEHLTPTEATAVSGDPRASEPPTAAGGPERSAGERSSAARSGGPPAAVGTPPIPAAKLSVPDPEVVPKARRRYYTADYKLRVLREADACREAGEIGALLRREGLYSSSLTEWRRLRDKGFLAEAGGRKRGRKAKIVDPNAKRLAELERENQKLSEKLRKAEIIIDFQKKVQDLLRMQEEGGTR